MKKLLSSVLLAIFLFNAIGYYPLFVLMTNSNQEKMFERLSQEHNLQELRIHRSEMAGIVFEEDGKEIIYKGGIYDVREQRTEGEYIIFSCIDDKHEGDMLAGLERNCKPDGANIPAKKRSENAAKKGIEHFYAPGEQVQYPTGIHFVLGILQVNFSSFQPAPPPPPPPQLFG